MMYCVRNVNDHSLAWSNKCGWVDNDSYDLFTPAEKEAFDLPLEGEWWGVQ